jgi:hypothetical protein
VTEQLSALIVDIDFTGVPIDEWSEWYDTEHLPERAGMPGWLTTSRWLAADGSPRSLGAYDLTTLDALQSPEYLAVRDAGSSPWTKRIHRLRDAQNRPSKRRECRQLLPGDELAPSDASFLLLVSMNVDAGREAEFNDWYDTEHLPGLRTVPGVQSGRRFLVTNADHRLTKYLATYHVDAPEVVTSAPWTDVTKTAWSRSIGPAMSEVELTIFARPDLVKADV